MEQENIIIVSVFAAAWALLLLIIIIICVQVSSLRKKVDELQNTGRLRVQKLKMNPDKNFAYHNQALSPEEELSRRGYSMYSPDGDVEAGRDGDRHEYPHRDPHRDPQRDPHRDAHRDRYDSRERQTGGHFVEDLTRELETRQQRQSTAPPFLLQAIEENKRKSRTANPMANGRQSETNPNFIY